jgi:hypothetical protein
MYGRYHTIIRPHQSNIVEGPSMSPKQGSAKNLASLSSLAEVSPSTRGRVFLTRSANRVTSHSVLPGMQINQ